MGFDQLKKQVCKVNKALVDAGLVVLTWGNASGVDREAGVMAIKPSGVNYELLKASDIVVLSLESGKVVEGDLNPSSDTPTHLLLYQKFESIGGIVHTHSRYATSWAQACREIPCFGTTHADHFYGVIPVARGLTPEEIETSYEYNTGVAIIDRFVELGIDPAHVPGVLMPSHAPFAWGKDPQAALENAIVLEEVARMGMYALMLNPSMDAIPQALLDKHFFRKHGPGASYGQK